ncbi:hypothetical protein [Catalinimonas niigatensis]|uniref:hypothetical protein n=1 Tax=Catalinimonas niigatensis TaxID=1397264 RepID=UPI0026656375|nr:hypothetical protein [Catalinimonas niigatensis]WPP50215.1 hypothetical protein PZB72_26475 [Catalinimonas niigatensis]
MLTIQEFNLLALHYKEKFAMEHGHLIMRRQAYPYLVGLFQLEKFYAEVWYDVRINRICEVITHEEKELFTNYSDFIHLESLY